MADTTENYGFLKPLVGGSENEWGGNLNDNFNELDKLLSGESPVNGINIESGSIDGSLITGELGKPDIDLEDEEEPLKLHPDTHLNGKVNKLTGMTPDAADDNDKGLGLIEDCVIEARDLEVAGYVKEGSIVKAHSTDATFNPNDGTIQYMYLSANEYEFDINLRAAGEQVTLILQKEGADVVDVVWTANSSGAVKWMGGASPDLDQGLNVIQFFSFEDGTGIRVVGAFSGIAS
jgi:hypothetical protein